MTLDEVIEIYQDILTHVEPGDPPEEHDAIKLGIASVKYVQYLDKYAPILSRPLFPGETKKDPST